MSRSMPDPFEGLYLPLLAIICAVILYLKFPTASLIVAILLVTAAAALIWLHFDSPIGLTIGLALGTLVLCGALFFFGLPMLAIAGISVGHLALVTLGVWLHFEEEWHYLAIGGLLLLPLAAGGFAYHFLGMQEAIVTVIVGIFIALVALAVVRAVGMRGDKEALGEFLGPILGPVTVMAFCYGLFVFFGEGLRAAAMWFCISLSGALFIGWTVSGEK